MELSQIIEELISQKASSFEVSKAFKASLKEYLNSLDENFEHSGKDFLVKHTKFIDNFVTQIYKYVLREAFSNYQPFLNSIPITLIALGSYGREQLCIYSDIDLMIVYKDIKGFNTKPIIEQILYTAWDAGLKLGHRVHEVSEIFDISNDDITIKTSLIESRFICGSKSLWFEVENGLKRVRKYNQKEFATQKIMEYNERIKKNPLTKEPNLKEGFGGFRDANTLFWIANIVYGVKSLKELVNILYSEDDYKEINIALETLFKVRIALHLSAKKKEDRVLFDLIPDVCKRLGIKDSNSHLAQTLLMQKILHSLNSVYRFSAIFINKISRKFFYNQYSLKVLKSCRVAPNIYIKDGTLYSSFNVENSDLNQILTLFIKLKDIEIKFDSSIFYLLSRVKVSKISADLIKKLFSKKYLAQYLELFYNSNIFTTLFPASNKIINLAQFDGYHEYAVDIHSILAIKKFEELNEPHLIEIVSKLEDEELLLLKFVILFHDFGKGRKGDHSILGERLFNRFAKRFFKEELLELGAYLIKIHILMNNTAHHEDIYHELIILSFIAKVKNKKILDMLYILTVVDMSAVGKNIYTKFSSKLLNELYNLALDGFGNSLLISETAQRVKKEESLKKYLKDLPHDLVKKILHIESNLFFLKFDASSIIEISKIAYKIEDFEYKIIHDNSLKLEIIKKKELNLGYLLGKLSNFDLASMDIFKLFDGVKYFRMEFYKNIDSEDIPFIEEIIKNSFDMKKTLKLTVPNIKRDDILLNPEHSKSYAEFKLNTIDQRGLVAYFAKLFDDFGIDIVTAKVHTKKNYAKDLFLIEKNENFWNNKDKLLDMIFNKGN